MHWGTRSNEIWYKLLFLQDLTSHFTFLYQAFSDFVHNSQSQRKNQIKMAKSPLYTPNVSMSKSAHTMHCTVLVFSMYVKKSKLSMPVSI